jgi:hypothetical protein
MYNNYGYSQPSGGGGGTVLILLLLMMLPSVLALGYVGYKKSLGEDPFDFLKSDEKPIYRFEIVDGEPVITEIQPSDCKGEIYVKKKQCSRNGVILDGTEGKCGPGKEEWILDPNAPGFEVAIGTGSCPVDNRDCEVPCDEPCKGQTWIEGPCMRDGVVLDGSDGDKCGRGMRSFTLNENASDYKAAIGRGVCTKNYENACTVECPPNVVAPPSCVYSSTWQKSANGCVVSKEDNAAIVGYDQVGWQEKFKLALEAENCTGEKRLSEWETCQGPPAPVDCEGTWGQNEGWGVCIGSCGTQPSQIRTYTVTKQAANGGSSCPYSDNEVQSRNCGNIITCPVDCAGRWIDTACPSACGTAATTVNKTWYTSTYPQGTGKACPAPDDPESIKSCPATAACPSDCKGDWENPACPTACGTAASTLTREWVTQSPKVGTGAACPSAITKWCPATAACPSDCKGYHADPACPTACGYVGGNITKNWVKTADPIGTGAACPSPSTKSCPATVACPSDCRGQWNRTNECRSRHYDGRAGMSRYFKEYKYNYGITHTKIGTGADCPNNTGDVKWQGNIVAYANRNC